MTSSDAPEFKAAIYRVGPRTIVPLDRREGVASATDPMSNQMCLKGADVRAMLSVGGQGGRAGGGNSAAGGGSGGGDESGGSPGGVPLSDPALRALLHELTHHATFAGNVGIARAALATTVCGRASMLVWPTNREELVIPQRDDLVLRFHEVVYEPLIEGLAVFAEHDIRWGASPFASHPLLHIWSFALHAKASAASFSAAKSTLNDKNDEKAQKPYSDWINNYLLEVRTRDYWIEQKIRLLKQPLLGASGPAYLLGYLAVKRAYLVLRQTSPGYSDSDVFLLLMLKYWFSDQAVADKLVLLDDLHVLAVQETLGAMSEIFQDNWDNLYLYPGKVARELLVKMGDTSVRRVEPTSEFGSAVGIRTAGDGLSILVPKFYKHRLVLRLGVLRVNIRSDKERRLAEIWDAHTNERLLDCPIAELADTGEFPGSIEIVRTYDGEISAIVVLGGSGLVAVRELFGDKWNPPALVELFDDLPSFELVEASVEAYRQSPFARRWEHPDYSDIDRNAMDAAQELSTSAYFQLAFRGLSNDQRDVAMATIGKDGFKGFFPEERDLKELALLSIYFGGPGAEIGSVANILGRSHAAVLAQLEAFNDRVRPVLRVNIFEIEGDVATAAI